jgi:hypothetical protein
MAYKLRASDVKLLEALVEAQKANKEPDPKMAQIIKKTIDGAYNDYFHTQPSPKLNLYSDLNRAGYFDLAKRVTRGDFNGTTGEKDEWLKTLEGQEILDIVQDVVKELEDEDGS